MLTTRSFGTNMMMELHPNKVLLKNILKRGHGFTLIELGIVLVIIALSISTFLIAVGSYEEDGDAILVKTSQAQLEQAISQASIRQDDAPLAVMGNAGFRTCIVKIVRLNLGVPVGPMTATGCTTPNVTDGISDNDSRIRFNCTDASSCSIIFPKRGDRRADFVITNSGRVNATLTTNWTKYQSDAEGQVVRRP